MSRESTSGCLVPPAPLRSAPCAMGSAHRGACFRDRNRGGRARAQCALDCPGPGPAAIRAGQRERAVWYPCIVKGRNRASKCTWPVPAAGVLAPVRRVSCPRATRSGTCATPACRRAARPSSDHPCRPQFAGVNRRSGCYCTAGAHEIEGEGATPWNSVHR
jgi:hypothetical protein